jgi:hypothetical protein
MFDRAERHVSGMLVLLATVSVMMNVFVDGLAAFIRTFVQG